MLSLFLPFIGTLEKVCVWFVPKKEGALELGPQYLEKHLLETPPIALEQAQDGNCQDDESCMQIGFKCC